MERKIYKASYVSFTRQEIESLVFMAKNDKGAKMIATRNEPGECEFIKLFLVDDETSAVYLIDTRWCGVVSNGRWLGA